MDATSPTGRPSAEVTAAMIATCRQLVAIPYKPSELQSEASGWVGVGKGGAQAAIGGGVANRPTSKT